MSRKHIAAISVAGAAGLLIVLGLLGSTAGPSSDVAGSPPNPSNAYRVTEGSSSSNQEPASSEANPEDPKRSSSNPDAEASPPNIPNFVKAEVPEHESWMGATCAPPRRGSLCQVPFQGGMHTSEEVGVLHFLAFENGKSEPSMHHQFPVKKGLTKIDTWLEYRIGPDTDWVEFRVELRNDEGQVLASSFPQRIPIHTPSG